MLADELSGIAINKTFHRINLKTLLHNRSDASIEFKHQNISAVLIKLGLPYIKGYKPKWNYQQILQEKIIKYLSIQKGSLEPYFLQFAESQNITSPNVNFNSFVDIPPEKQSLFLEPEIKYEHKPIKINYLEREQRNSSLGAKGEGLIIEYERWRLIALGKNSLANKIEWVAQNDDGAGYDILSKNENGSDRYIEVKTTKLSKETPIFFTKNEYEFSQTKKEAFYLYRLFNFNQIPKMFTVHGSFDDFCIKESIQFKGYF